MDDARTPTSEQLLAEMGWVRQLARALVKDVALADDVAQDTWLVAAEREPDADQPLKPWLARVVKNLVHTRRRSHARRTQREASVVDERVTRTPAELIERVELQRAVADEVLALAEPYRSTVLLHFVDGHSSAEISRRLGIPDGTVRRRLKVALDQLRAALAKRSDQPQRGWLAALVPFAMSNDVRPTPTAIGAIAMKKILAIVVLLCLLLAIGGGVIWHRRARHSDATAGSGSVSSSTPAHHPQVGGEDAARLVPIPPWVPQTGAPARRIAGRVVFQGAPVGGARVRLGFEAIGELGAFRVTSTDVSVLGVLQPVAQVMSAPDGTFDFGLQPATRFTVTASADSYATGAISVDNANPHVRSDRLSVSLGACGMRLSGVVSDASGGPIAKAAISVDGVDGAESNANGAFKVCLTPKDVMGMPRVEVRVEADGYGTTHETVLAVGDISHEFLLVPEAIIVGRVVSKAGEGIAGARVVAQAEPQEIARHVASGFAYSDGDGRFRIARLAPGAFQLWAKTQGRTSSALAVFAQPTTTSREIQLVVDNKPLARVSGHVYKSGQPVSGAQVQAVQDGGPGGGCTTQADGSFVFDAMPYGKTRFFVAPSSAEASAEVDITQPVVDGIRVEIKKAATVRGHVTRKGKPVNGADIVYMPPPQATFYGGQPATKTDSSGAYLLELPAGAGQLCASDYSQKAFSFRPVELGADEDKTMDIELDSAGEVTGTVVNEAGGPVAGVYMRLDITDGSGDMCESMTDANGQFDCALLTGGEYRATVTPSPGARRGFTPARPFSAIQVPKDGVITGVQLAIKDERLAIRGTVVDETGSPMSDVHVTAVAPGESSMDPPATLTDATGRFEIANLARGPYAIEAHAADGSEGSMPDVAAGSNAVSIKLARAGAIDGTLINFSNAATVFYWSTTNGPPKSGRAMVQGAKFSRVGVTPGSYIVEALAGLDTDAVIVEVRAGETAHAELRRRDVGTVEGKVVDVATRKPIAGMRCDAKPVINGRTTFVPPDVPFQAFSDVSGYFKVNAPVGRVRLRCAQLSGGPLNLTSTDVDVKLGQPAKVNVLVGGESAP